MWKFPPPLLNPSNSTCRNILSSTTIWMGDISTTCKTDLLHFAWLHERRQDNSSSHFKPCYWSNILRFHWGRRLGSDIRNGGHCISYHVLRPCCGLYCQREQTKPTLLISLVYMHKSFYCTLPYTVPERFMKLITALIYTSLAYLFIVFAVFPKRRFSRILDIQKSVLVFLLFVHSRH